MGLLKHFPHLTHDKRTKDAECRLIEVRIRHYAEGKNTEKLLLDLIMLYEETNDAEKVEKIIGDRAEAHALRCKKCQTSKSCYRFDEIMAISEILFL